MKTLKQLITESVNEYLREIEEAGNNEAIERKMAKCEEAIALRERKINKEGIEEAMHDMIDPKKIKELQKEVKVIEKTLKKYQKQLEKLKSKNKHVGVKDDEDSTEEKEEIIDEVSLGENDTEDEERYDEEGNVDPNGMYDAGANYIGNEKHDMQIDKMKYDYSLNESFLYMQKLAGIITETQYQVKKVLNRKKSIAEGMEEMNDEIFKKISAAVSDEDYNRFIDAATAISEDLISKGFEAEDIYDYLNNITLNEA